MNVVKKAFSSTLQTFGKAIKDTALSLLNLVLSFVFQFWPITSIAHSLRSKFPKFWNYLMGLGLSLIHI